MDIKHHKHQSNRLSSITPTTTIFRTYFIFQLKFRLRDGCWGLKLHRHSSSWRHSPCNLLCFDGCELVRSKSVAARDRHWANIEPIILVRIPTFSQETATRTSILSPIVSKSIWEMHRVFNPHFNTMGVFLLM